MCGPACGSQDGLRNLPAGLNRGTIERLARPVVCVSEVQQLFRNTELQQGVTRARVDYDQSLECCRLTRPLWITRVGIAGDGCDQRAKRGVASSCACTALPAYARRYIELFAWPGEQNEVAVRITHDEGSRTPGLAPEGLNKFDACRLIFEKEWLRVIERNRSGKQLLRVASDGVNDPIVDAAKIQSRAITEHLPVEWRLAVAERDGEPEFPRVELSGDSDVSNEELGFSCEKRGH